jgi:hypothetical protein
MQRRVRPSLLHEIKTTASASSRARTALAFDLKTPKMPQ